LLALPFRPVTAVSFTSDYCQKVGLYVMPGAHLVGSGPEATPSLRNGSYRPGKPLFD